MLQLIDHCVVLLLKLVSYLLFILFILSSFQFLKRLIENPTTIKELIYIFKTFPALSSIYFPFCL